MGRCVRQNASKWMQGMGVHQTRLGFQPEQSKERLWGRVSDRTRCPTRTRCPARDGCCIPSNRTRCPAGWLGFRLTTIREGDVTDPVNHGNVLWPIISWQDTFDMCWGTLSIVLRHITLSRHAWICARAHILRVLLSPNQLWKCALAHSFATKHSISGQAHGVNVPRHIFAIFVLSMSNCDEHWVMFINYWS